MLKLKTLLLFAIAILVAPSCASDRQKNLRATPNAIVYSKVVRQDGRNVPVVWIANTDGRNPHRLTWGGGPTISPNGRWITFWRNFTAPNGAPLYIYDRQKNKTRILAQRVYNPVVWSSDSTKVVLQVAQKTIGLTELEVVNPATSRGTAIANGEINNLTISEDNQWVAYDAVSGESRGYPETDVFVVSINGGASIKLTRDGLSSEPIWGPKAISYVRMTAKRTWPTEVWSLRFKGEKKSPNRRLSVNVGPFTPGAHWEPIDWWPDGRYLLVGVNPDQHGYFAIYKLDTKTRHLREIVSSKALIQSAQLSKNGRLVLTTYGNGSIEIVSATTGRVLRHVGRGDSAVWNR
jgi:Tol biopolymer transport system component